MLLLLTASTTSTAPAAAADPNTACYDMRFGTPQAENTQQNAYFTFSERGIQRYAELNVDKAFSGLLGRDLGDIRLDLLAFEFQINRLRITEIENPAVLVQLLPAGNEAECRLEQLKLALHFEFVVEHNVFPYFRDAGDGKLLISVSDMQFLVKAIESPDCPGELNLVAEQSMSHISGLEISFNSNLSYLYNAVMPLVSQYLLELFNEELSRTLVDQLIAFANDRLNTLIPIGQLSYDSKLIYDQRWIGEVQIIDRQFYIPTSGVTCVRTPPDGVCVEKQRQPGFPRATVVNNADITYELSRNVFNSALEYVWEMNQSYIAENMGIEDLRIEIARIANTGLVFDIRYVRDGEQRGFEAIGPLVPSQFEFDTLVVARFSPTLKTVTETRNEADDIADTLKLQVNDLISNYAFAVKNGFNIDLGHAVVIYLPDNWVAVCANVAEDPN